MRLKYLDIIMSLLGLVYILSCLMVLSDSVILRYTLFITRCVLFLFSVDYIRKHNKSILWVYLPFFLYYFSYGLINGNWINFIIMDLLSSFVLVFVFFYNHDNRDYITRRIINLLSLLVLLSSIVTAYYFISNELQPAESIGNRIIINNYGSTDFFKIAFSVIQISLLLLPFIWYVDFKRKIFIGMAFFIFSTVSLMLLFRANMGASALSIMLTILIGFRKGFIYFNFKSIVFISIASLLILVIARQYFEIIERLFSFLILRFQDFGNVEVSPRDLEANVYFSAVSIYELLLGKGMGAANMFPFGNYSEKGIMMMHRGENNLILKGGIVYLILIYGAAFISLIKLFRSKVTYGYSWAAVILIYLLLERGHQQYSQFFMLLFFSLAISYAFSIKSFKILKKVE